MTARWFRDLLLGLARGHPVVRHLEPDPPDGAEVDLRVTRTGPLQVICPDRAVLFAPGGPTEATFSHTGDRLRLKSRRLGEGVVWYALDLTGGTK